MLSKASLRPLRERARSWHGVPNVWLMVMIAIHAGLEGHLEWLFEPFLFCYGIVLILKAVHEQQRRAGSPGLRGRPLQGERRFANIMRNCRIAFRRACFVVPAQVHFGELGQQAGQNPDRCGPR